ncbi:hypothetical protein F5Y14DRAFT_71557 [Nemania sp. NC0429]|nr:hypothetical protein F5Y14DRAFT_71557 [Nemania sp. NC0429]
MPTITPIPSPPGLPLIGNAAQIDTDSQFRSFSMFADKYGEIFRLHLPGGNHLVLGNSYRIVDELCDEKRFVKIPGGVLGEIRNGVHDGLFTVSFTVLQSRLSAS